MKTYLLLITFTLLTSLAWGLPSNGTERESVGENETVPPTTPVPAVDPSSAYQGLIGNIILQVNQEQCSYVVNETVQAEALLSLKSLRAMEWLFATSSISDTNFDCVGLTYPHMKNKVGTLLSTERAKAIRIFNEQMALIEADQETVIKSKSSSTALVDYDGGKILESKLADRKLTGYDALKLMERRNHLFQAYELKMQQIIDSTFAPIKEAALMIRTVNPDSQTWSIGDLYRDFKDVNCRREAIMPDKLYDMWSHRFIVENMSVNKAPLLEGGLPHSYIQGIMGAGYTLPNDWYHMANSILPGGMPVSGFGNAGLGAFGSNIRFRFFNAVSSTTTGNLTALRETFKTKLLDYLISQKPTEAAAHFIPEIELVKIKRAVDSQTYNLVGADSNAQPFTSPKDCLSEVKNTPNTVSEECAPLRDYIQEIADIAFAQHWLFSYSGQSPFLTGFGKDGSTLAMLFAHYETVYVNLAQYYLGLAGVRSLQNSCINRLIEDIEDRTRGTVNGGILGGSGNGALPAQSYGQTQGGGSGEKGKNFYSMTEGSRNGGRRSANGSGVSLSKGPDGKSSIDIANLNKDSFSGNPLLDKFGVGSSGVGASASASASGGLSSAMSARIKEIKTNLEKSQQMGSSSKNKAHEKLVAALGKTLGSAGVSSSPQGIGNQGLESADNKSKAAEVIEEDFKSKSQNKMGNNVSGGQGGSAYYGNERGSSSPSSDNTNNPTGMTSEEQDTMVANRDRNKDKYQSQDGDNLFDIISKSYIRNIDRFFTKKKPIE